MAYYNFRTDVNHRNELLKRFKENIVSMGWGGADKNLDLRNKPDFKNVYPGISNRRINSIKKIQSFQDNDVLIIPKMPKDGKFIIAIVKGNYPECYSYKKNDKTHLNHCIKVKKIYGLNSELDCKNDAVREWYAKLGWMRTPIYPLFRYASLFKSLLNELDKQSDLVLGVSDFSEFINKRHEEVKKMLTEELLHIHPCNSDISFENVCKEIIETYGYKLVKNNHHLNGGDADLIFEKDDESDDLLINPFVREEKRLYVQIKKHEGESGKKAVEQLIKIIREDHEESAQCVAITLGVFNEEAETLAEENNIILINGDQLVELFIERLL